MKLPISVVAATLGAFVLAAPVGADVTSEQVVTVTKVDFKGRPPFKRRTETLPVENVASLETQHGKSSGEYVTVTTVDFKGKPPFKRRTETLFVEDVASFEVEPLDNDAENKMKFHGKPPYRR